MWGIYGGAAFAGFLALMFARAERSAQRKARR
jgi:hypothetical protein